MCPPAQPVTTIDPPPIPAARTGPINDPGHHTLIWVRSGAAHVRFDDIAAFRITAGEGAWIPAGGHSRPEIVTEPGTVAFPLWSRLDVGPGAGGPSELTRFDVPAGWQDWLIQHFNLQVTPLTGHGYTQDGLVDLLRHPRARLSAPQRGENVQPRAFGPPALPRIGRARAVAEELMSDPALDLTIEQWAVRVLSSPRTLLRDFLTDTGLTFEQWRLRCRLSAAVELLTAGYGVDQVTTRAGFVSRNGFTRAFKQHFGLTPHAFSRAPSAQPLRANPFQRVTAMRQAGDLVRMTREVGASTDTPRLLPSARTLSHTNDSHVLSWMYRGSGYLDIGDQHYERQRGIATWIPAAVEHITGIRENSISLPLGNASTADLKLTEPLQMQFSPAWDDYLMFCSISARSRLRPDGYDPRHVLGLFSEQVAAQRALEVPMPTNSRARQAAMEYLRRIGASGGSAVPDIPPDVHQAFRAETGMTFARWRYAARMRIARDLLTGGAKPSAVARRVGYAHLPTFSTAFSRFHGLSPREYQERQIET